ncbi:MAG: GLUG motif-containing protein [Planctomycetota bacterium]
MCYLKHTFGFVDKNKKHSRLMNVLLMLLFTCLFVLTAKAEYGGGTGQPDNPYLIYTAEQMNEIGANPNDWERHFKLMADIDLSRYKGEDFNIIGKLSDNGFSGVFDGNNKKISNFTYNSMKNSITGLFGRIGGSEVEIRDLGLIDPTVDAGSGWFVGSLVGYADSGTFTNCYVKGGSVSGERTVGGLFGRIYGGTITNCHAEGCSISGNEYVGGLVGSSSASIIACYATGSVFGIEKVGGFVGQNKSGIIDSYSHASIEGENNVGGFVGDNRGSVVDCYCSGTLIAKDQTGGLVGINHGIITSSYSSTTVDGRFEVGGLVGTNENIITASYSSTTVNGRYDVGGLVGYNSNNAEISDCYANGDVTGRNYVGGLVGNNVTVYTNPFFTELLSGTIHNCYSVTLVSGQYDAGGLVGYNGDDGVSGSFWDIQTSGQITSSAGVGKTTLEMQDPQTFIDAGWGFFGAQDMPGDTWAEPEGGGYPILKWQVSTPSELPVFSGGTGEKDDPYLISTVDELNSIGYNPRLMNSHFKLINDIDLTGIDFNMIASQYFQFQGTFDGNDHTISNFSYTSPEASGVGLLRYVSNGRIVNLGLISPNVHVDEGEFHGCLVGALSEGIVTNCYVESGSITGQDELGGLVGENGSGGIIMNCCFTANATGRDSIGGLVGNNLGSIKASYSNANVEGRNAVGGLVGRCSPGEAVNCYAIGNVVGQWYVGGLVGTNGSGSGHSVGTIHNCYSASVDLRGTQKGGLLGADWGGEVNNCFWDTETCGLTKSYGGEGKTTAEMQSAGMFLNVGWDFVGETENGTEDIWWILDAQEYPRLWWETDE